MYEFISTNENQESIWLPSVAMIFNGLLLEQEIKGYQTLNVEGRETISYDLETSGNISGRDGVISFGKTLPPRLLRVQYRLEAESNEELQHSFRLLNWKLETNGEVPIKFRDDLDITYYGELTTMSEIPADRNTVVGTFEIHCSDPFKYETVANQTGNPLKVYSPTPYQVKPDLIQLTLKGATSKIVVTNTTTGRKIILNGTYATGDVIRIRLKETEQGKKITKNNQNIMNQLDYMTTDFHDFQVKKEDVLQVTPLNTEMTVEIRGRWK